MELLSPSDLLKAAELATNAGDPALALQFLKTASAAAKTHHVVDIAFSGAIKPIEEPGVVQPLLPNAYRPYSSAQEIYMEICKFLRNQDPGYTFRFFELAGYIVNRPDLVLDTTIIQKSSSTTLAWKASLSNCMKRLLRKKILSKGNARTEYILERHPWLFDA